MGKKWPRIPRHFWVLLYAINLLGAESTPGLWYGRKEMSLKNPVTPPGIDPGTVRLVAQRLNHYAIPGPSDELYLKQILCKEVYCVHLPGNRNRWMAFVNTVMNNPIPQNARNFLTS